ncbi:MAG: signal peptidase I, partial [bacterium]
MENISFTQNLNLILYFLAGLLTLVELFIRVVWPRLSPAAPALGLWKASKPGSWMETVDSLWIAMVVALTLKALLIQPFTIPSGSMEDTLQIGDYILVKKYEYGYSLLNKTPRFLEFNKPHRGDVMVFVYPDDHTKDFIKRCIGLPGDVIQLKNAQMYLNGVKQNEPYVKHLFTPDEIIAEEGPDSLKVNFGPVTVLPGHYFMMGDNRDNSLDSRYWGQLDGKLIKGKAWMIYWHSVNFHPDLHRMFHMIDNEASTPA